jgi:hypothetical protein
MNVSRRNQPLKGVIKNGPIQNGQTSEVNNNNSSAEKSSFRVMLVVFIGLLMDLMAFAVILPLLPSLLDHYSKDEEVSIKRNVWCTVNIWCTFVYFSLCGGIGQYIFSVT